MGDGMRRAVLAAVCSRGPWSGGVGASAWVLSPEELRALYAAVPVGYDAMLASLRVARLSTRKASQALQLLRNAQLIERHAGTWRYPETAT